MMLGFLLVVACHSASYPILETKVARLRIELDELKAKHAEGERRRDSESRGKGAAGTSEGTRVELQAELQELRVEQARLAEKLENRPTEPSGRRPQRPRPDPTSVYSVDVVDRPFLGAKHAKVTLVKHFEFACPFCNKAEATMTQLLKDYQGDIKIVYKHFIVHPQTATEPAQAACAADMQGKFAKMKQLLWDQAFSVRDFSRSNIEGLARKAKLRMARFRADRDGICVARVQLDQSQARPVGVTGTPAFFINGRFLSGARPIDQFKKVIDEELSKANARIGRGEAAVANYYERFVLDAGLKKLATP